ncbi:hypothetical protein BDFB_007860 [Asbolus verrucosus]|uniref:Uncharacterized protein n=1 Tax=Asbolus verrucosus TaxID=1661398 RepID=A0A482VUF2_ASBVE|nr:hypothetical protein BDFB_007860 [Asbolus verrucosus]
MKTYAETKISDSPLELTTTKISVVDNENEHKLDTSKANTFSGNLSDRKVEIPLQDQVEPMFPSMGQEANPSGLILPPPPPVWYPSLYPTTTPYGIDPLHFFIDLRVSGHIYDRKNQREADAEASTTKAAEAEDSRQKQISIKETFKQSRHASAFSVPTPRVSRTTPINLSHNEDYPEFNAQESKNIKFDVKSMGFEKTCNKTGTTYIMNNITSIYKSVAELSQQSIKSETSSESAASNENDNETEEQKEKRVKDLRALIGLELVVDYMNHAKPQPRRIPDQNHFTDTESTGSPTLEVVAVHEET